MLPATLIDYSGLLKNVSLLLENARRSSARVVNSIITATYWNIGQRIVKYEQAGKLRAEYGRALLAHLSADLTKRFGRGFSADNLETMRLFYNAYPTLKISETVSRKSSEGGNEFNLNDLSKIFPLSWSHYVLFVRRDISSDARNFYEMETLRCGWSVRQLERQIETRFYERTLLSKNKKVMLSKGAKLQPQDIVTPEQEIKDPYVLEFLDLKDEYSENDLEEALIRHLESFLLELGGDFAFIGRQKRLRLGNEWYRVDLVFYHRCLKCLILIDLKLGKFTHADAGQMHLYLNYAREHWTRAHENPPVGLILCADKNAAIAKYALEGLPNKVLAAEYKLVLPKEDLLISELKKTRKSLIVHQRSCKKRR